MTGADRSRLPPEPARAPVPSVSTEITAVTVVDSRRSAAPAPASTPRAARDAARKGAIYRIQPDGLWDTMWESGDDCAVRSA